ncbi:E3 ubiquitin-protein ligase RNF25 [Chionoecetes opilio]|uniref:E3 ubiquitin-protein ligase RNF25 n=1 Tax=Chionoecetes opilio TaxID=41210 RepID=A0A8J4Y3S1_CHIOP|nr:E3 ubiquitin-protein ligase RNF25 [Chionoecetes opilio]
MEEIEALQAIMLDEVTVLHGDGSVPGRLCGNTMYASYPWPQTTPRGVPAGVEVVVVPATAQNVKEQHVRVTLVISLSPDYPDVSPTITLRNPRGVDDDVLQKIHQESKQRCEEYLGCPVIYELIEVVRDNLTANNTPSCPCAICLHHFTDTDTFTKTRCFHYFHSYCLGRWVPRAKQEYIASCVEEAAAEEEEPQPAWMAREKKLLMCPVCRDPIQNELNGEELLCAAPPEEEENTEEFRADDPELVALQHKMAQLYLKQKEKGGIINLEEEKNKFLLSSNRVDFCEGLGGSLEEEANLALPNTPEEGPPENHLPAPPTARRGGRPAQPRSQGHRTHGGYGRQPWRHTDHGGDGRYWAGNRGGRGGSGGRGRGAGRGGTYTYSRIIPEHKEYSAPSLKSSCVIDGGLGTKSQARHNNPKYENGSIYHAGDNRAETCFGARGGGGGAHKRGAKGPGSRQRYGRGRGRGNPANFTPSGQRHPAEDWS